MKESLEKELSVIASLSDLCKDEQEELERFIQNTIEEEVRNA
jgi:hypothetical protein